LLDGGFEEVGGLEEDGGEAACCWAGEEVECCYGGEVSALFLWESGWEGDNEMGKA